MTPASAEIPPRRQFRDDYKLASPNKISKILTDNGSQFTDSRADLQATLLHYLKLYNHHIPQRAMGSKTPIRALKEWQRRRPDLLVKRRYDKTGLAS
jgi:hypothetical protein